jgi:hypothetical protein
MRLHISFTVFEWLRLAEKEGIVQETSPTVWILLLQHDKL